MVLFSGGFVAFVIVMCTPVFACQDPWIEWALMEVRTSDAATGDIAIPAYFRPGPPLAPTTGVDDDDEGSGGGTGKAMERLAESTSDADMSGMDTCTSGNGGGARALLLS